MKKGGAIGDITTASGTDTITLEAGSFFMLNKSNQAPTINTGSGDDTITINGILSTTGSNVTIDFGDGTNDTLVLSGDATLTKFKEIKNVNKIDLTNSTANNIDFSKVSGSVTIDKVQASSTITLNSTQADNKTVNLAGENATILNVTSGDKIDFNNVATDLSTAITATTFSEANSTGSSISASGAYVWNNGIEGFDKQDQVKTQIKDVANNLNGKALVAVKNTNQDKSAIYLVSGSGTAGNGNGDNIDLKLLGIVGNKIDNQDKLDQGVITFA